MSHNQLKGRDQLKTLIPVSKNPGKDQNFMIGKRESEIWGLTSRTIQVALTWWLLRLTKESYLRNRRKLRNLFLERSIDDGIMGIWREQNSGFISVFLVGKEAEFISFFPFSFSLTNPVSFRFIPKHSHIFYYIPYCLHQFYHNYFSIIYFISFSFMNKRYIDYYLEKVILFLLIFSQVFFFLKVIFSQVVPWLVYLNVI